MRFDELQKVLEGQRPKKERWDEDIGFIKFEPG